MKHIFYILLLISTNVYSTIYYVSDTSVTATASDANAGTDINNPWFSWEKALAMAEAGDTVYFRAGIYYLESPINVSVEDDEMNDGNYDSVICFFGYPTDIESGDSVVFDFSGNTITEPDYELVDTTDSGYQYNGGFSFSWADYFHLKDFTIRNVYQKYRYVQTRGINFYACNNFILENLVVYNASGQGIFSSNNTGTDTTYIINCDAYNCIDSFAINPYNYNLGQAGSWGVGFFFVQADSTQYMEFDSCRAWCCADDGYNTNPYGVIRVKSCWSFLNGVYLPYLEYTSPGNGYKLNNSSDTSRLPDNQDIINHYVTNCISAFNHSNGYDENHNAGAPSLRRKMYNNVAYRNEQGFVTTQPDLDGWVHRNNEYINNIGYDNSYADKGEYQGAYFQTDSCNSWNEHTGVTVTDADFILVDSATAISQLKAARDSAGHIPEITFLTLAETSDLINAGIYVELDTIGAGADLGYREYGTLESAELGTVILGTLTPSVYTAIVGGNAIDDGGGTVSAKGICYSSSQNPTTSNMHIDAGSGTGSFSSTIKGIPENTKQYIRAYITNEAGTAYSAQDSITTRSSSTATHEGNLILHNGKPIIIGSD